MASLPVSLLDNCEEKSDRQVLNDDRPSWWADDRISAMKTVLSESVIEKIDTPALRTTTDKLYDTFVHITKIDSIKARVIDAPERRRYDR